MKLKPIHSGFLLICLSLFSTGTNFAPLQPMLTNTIYDDALAPGWVNYSWATVNLAAPAPVHGGSKSISVSFGAWQGLFLKSSDVDTLGLTTLRFYIHGGSAGGQKMNIYLNLEAGGSTQTGPLVPVPPPAANAWSEVNIALNTLNPNNADVSGITWQDSSGKSQPIFYLDDIALISPTDPNGPQLSDGSLTPRSLAVDGLNTLVMRVHANDPQGAGDITGVTFDASSLGGGTVSLHDDGKSNDGVANDGLYGAAITIPTGVPAGERRLLVSAADKAGHQASLALGALNLLGLPGGEIPGALPRRTGWGSNAWSDTPGQDWQVNSGVSWDYVYQYITWGWETWGNNFTYRFVHQAWDKNYIPMVTVYMMLGLPPTCGESGSCYAQKLQNTTAVQAYLDSLKRAAQQSLGAKPVIFNIEPDFYGSMQQLSNTNSRPAGVRPNDPTSYPVALNKAGYANNLAGFGRYLVDLIHTTAPNALVAPATSTWATNSDPQSVTDAEAVQMAQTTSAFIEAMGGAQADLLVVEWGDRDAGSGLRPWWDDHDQITPRPTRAILWENALSSATHKRLLLWQVPVGNMALDNTPTHYQDNRAAYAFAHPRDLFEAGIIGVLFGGGNGEMTQVNTDGGFVAAQGAIAYGTPAAPLGLSAGTVSDVFVPLRWNENSEPDFWKYRITYKKGPSGVPQSIEVGRRNAFVLLLPEAGTWEIRVSAIDAMGNESLPSQAVIATTNLDARHLFLPVVRKK